MKYFYIFVLILVACSDVTVNKCTPFEVTISDALPIQFWPSDCDTYNEKEVCGIHHKCFCHPWNCEDEIVIQFRDDNDDDFTLNVNDDSGLLTSMSFNKTNIFATEFDFQFDNNEFLVSLSNWNQYSSSPGSSAIWNWDASQSAKSDGTSGTLANTYEIYQGRQISGVNSYNKWPPGNYSFRIRIDNQSSGGSSPLQETLTIKAFDVPGGINESAGVTVTRGGGYLIYTVNLTTTQPWLYIGFITNKSGPTSGSAVKVFVDYIEMTESPLDYTESIYDTSFTPSELSICDTQVNLEIYTEGSPSELIAKSDCIDVRTSHDCTTLIEYTNNRNFAGLVYENVSPVTTFKILVPAIFFHERFPEEDNVIELSESIIQTSGQVKAQRLFETDYLPYYMHRKMKLILKHQTVLIDNQYWTKEESYEVQDGDRRWPVKKGKCFLTEKNYVQRAVL